MFKVFNPYSFDTDYDPISIVRLHSRGVDSAWAKRASASRCFDKEFADYKLEPGHSLVHLAPVAESERFSCNVNGDGFCKAACQDYHPTFLKGHAFREHDNKDPRKSYGRPVATAYNEKMGRVELLVDLDDKKNPTIKEALERGEPVDWSMACFYRVETPVLTEKGWTAIGRVRPGDYVLTHLGRWRRVTAVMQREYTGEVVHMRAKGIPCDLSSTADHPFMAMSRSAIPSGVAAGLGHNGVTRDVESIHDRSLTARWYRFRKTHTASNVLDLMQWTPAEKLSNGDKGMVVTGQRPLRHAVIVDENFAQLLGIFTAEGHGDIAALNFYAHKDDASRTFIPDLCEKLWGKRPSDREHPESDKARVITLCSTAARDEVVKYVGHTLANKQVPPEITAASRRVQHAFAGRWLDGDGWYDVKGAHWSTAKFALSLELRDMLLRLGYAPSIYRVKHSVEQGSKSNNVEYVVNIPPADVAEFAEFSAKLEEVRSQWESTPPQRGKSAIQPDGAGRAVCTFTGIRHEHVECETVYNLSVDEDESYVVAGVVTHNCRIDYDECNVCHNRATSPKGPCDQPTNVPSPGYCKHARAMLGALAEDGHRVYVDNPHPQWFDISQVKTPAEVIARTMNRKAASGNALIAYDMSGVGQAETMGLEIPLYTRCSFPDQIRAKMAVALKLADMEKNVPATLQRLKHLGPAIASPDTKAQHAVAELLTRVDSHAVAKEAALGVLRDNGIILSLRDFALLTKEANADVAVAARYLPTWFAELDRRALLTDVAADGTYDGVVKSASAALSVAPLAAVICPSMSLHDQHIRTRLVEVESVKLGHSVVERPELTAPSERLLRKYAAYVLSELATCGDDNQLRTRVALTALGHSVN